jgi:hypothetical protein
MCRSIKKLRLEDRMPSAQELEDASLQFVRKISGYRAPAQKNKLAFDDAVTEIAAVSRKLFENLHSVRTS